MLYFIWDLFKTIAIGLITIILCLAVIIGVVLLMRYYPIVLIVVLGLTTALGVGNFVRTISGK